MNTPRASHLTPPTSGRQPSPCRLMQAFLAQKSRLLAALNDEGGLFECRFLARLLDREQAGVTLASAQADTIQTEVTGLRQKALGYINDPRSPGQIDNHEAALLMQDLRRLGLHAQHHATHLEKLA
jgi:hypothetical protein